jgi:hypothetical protein
MNVKLATAFVALAVAAAAAAPLAVAGAPGTFSPTGSMATARQAPFAGTLADGRVLVGGGFDGSYLTSAEIYSPATGTFTPTGSLGHARAYAAAAPLPDGRVLIAGGYNPTDTRLDTATVFIPTLNGGVGDFSAAGIGTMSTSREGPIAAPLPDGRVLVAGGRSNGNVTQRSAETFDPATNAFTPVPGGNQLVVGREDAAAAPLPDGRVLIAGGTDTSITATATAEVFDPVTDKFSAVGSMSTPRNGPGAAPLPDGRVLVAGGQDTSFKQLSSAEIFDPATNAFTSAGVGGMTVERQFPSTAPLPDGRVLVAGGRGLGPIATSADLFTLAPRAPFKFSVRGTKLIFTAPVAGTVSVTDARATSPAAAKTKKKKRKKSLSLRPSSAVGGPGELTVALRLTGKAKKLFKATGKAKVKARISFAPRGECAPVFKSCYDAGTQTATLKLKKKSPKKRRK